MSLLLRRRPLSSGPEPRLLVPSLESPQLPILVLTHRTQ